MNAPTRNALSAYTQVGIETSVATASPHQLISMLYAGALVAIAIAKGHMQRHEVAAKGLAISRAIGIINEGLIVSLDEKAGGVLAQNLKALYEYMSSRLLMANLKNDEALLDEVSRLLNELKGAWDEIGKRPNVAPPPVSDAAPSRAPVSYGKA